MRQVLNFFTKIDTVVHLGSGLCSEMPEYLGLQSRLIVLVEADPEIVEQLEEEYQKLSQIKIVQAVVVPEQESVCFYRYSLTDANSTRAGTQLLQSYPGVRLLNKEKRQSLSVDSLLQKIEIGDGSNLLVIDLPGQEHEILKALEFKKLLLKFEHLAVYTNREPLYENASNSLETLEWMKQSGYQIHTPLGQSDYDRQLSLLTLNPLYLPLQAEVEARDVLKKELEEACRASDSLRSERDKAKEDRDSARTEMDGLVQVRDGLNKKLELLSNNIKDYEIRLAEKQKRIDHLVRDNQKFLNENEQIQERQRQLESELLKAEAQVKIIKELLLTDKV